MAEPVVEKIGSFSPQRLFEQQRQGRMRPVVVFMQAEDAECRDMRTSFSCVGKSTELTMLVLDSEAGGNPMGLFEENGDCACVTEAGRTVSVDKELRYFSLPEELQPMVQGAGIKPMLE